MNITSDEFTGPINLGNPAECTMLELAEKVCALTRSKSSIAFQPLPSDDPVQRQPDIPLARMHLDWAPRIDLEEGLMKAISYFEKLPSAS
jgi:UDP-glucuronate decarboxylase